nr:immunoglobulin heavy chain junction region [Mus musculus]
CVLGDAMDYW